ncbi:hypothetical protein AB0D38_00995 [Streptomyces sp. NPDC048279]|uniref:hypothetical protein n=1 Tax=Streptomyces sp. NPDC048279 TaxID=3154714 RepID=UPI00342184CA
MPLKAALWNVMSGGAAGSAARSLQDAHSLTTLFHQHLGTAISSLVLAVILSSAAIVFAARKSEAQSFITVEATHSGQLRERGRSRVADQEADEDSTPASPAPGPGGRVFAGCVMPKTVSWLH